MGGHEPKGTAGAVCFRRLASKFVAFVGCRRLSHCSGNHARRIPT